MGDLVAGYYRVSQARDGMHAPELYEQEIQRYCAYKNLVVSKIFSDIDYSGRRGSRTRPALEALKDRRQEFSAIVIPKLSRFGRSMKDLIHLFDLFDTDGVSLVFLDMNVDTSTSQGRLLRHVMAAFAEYESDVRSDYARANHELARRAGRTWTGNVPYGYIRGSTKTNSYYPHPHRAKVVREIFARFLRGESATGIARYLNAAGETTTNGRRWRTLPVRKLLDRATYAALIRLGNEFLPGNWEPLIDAATWDAVQVKLEGQRHIPKTRQLYLLSSMMVCGVCGHKLWHRRGPGNQGHFACGSSQYGARCPGGGISRRRADDIVSRAFLARDSFIVSTAGGTSGSIVNTEEKWKRLPMEKRRQLLSIAISRIVLVPRQGGSPKHPRDLIIEWIDEGSHSPLTMSIEKSAKSARIRNTQKRQTWNEFRRETMAFPPLKKSVQEVGDLILSDRPDRDEQAESHHDDQ